MSSPADGCARSPSTRGAGADAAPLPVDTPDPVRCLECGNVFGRGAEAGTVCPYCMGSLHPLPVAREGLDGDPTHPEPFPGGPR